MIKSKEKLKEKLKTLLDMDSCSFIVVKGDHEVCEQVCREIASEMNRPITHFKQGVHDITNDIYGFKVNGNYCYSPFTRACANGHLVLISRADQSEYRTLDAIKPAIDHGHYYEGSSILYDTIRDENGNSRAICISSPQDMKEVRPGFKVIASIDSMDWMNRWVPGLIDVLIYVNAEEIEPE